MHVVVCGSLAFTEQFGELKQQLEALGHEVTLPVTAQEILDGTADRSVEELESMKASGTHYERTAHYDAIRRYHKLLIKGDAVLVANYEKKDLPGYIGGNTFLEMGFAHVEDIPIFTLFEPSASLPYIDEIRAMQPTTIQHLSELKTAG